MFPGSDSVSNRNEHQECFWGYKATTASKADNITAIWEPIV
jgi:hypothetical protein